MHLGDRWLLVSAIAVGLLVAHRAEAHIQLLSPPSWTVEDGLGDPQKSAPCGARAVIPPPG